MKNTASNALPDERAGILDALRGFALLGILLANSAVFSLYIFNTPVQRESFFTAPVDGMLSFFGHAFIEGKFYSIFSLLFGIGFSIIFLRNKNKGKNGLLIFYRRLFILILFGLCHSFLLWDGDILFFYAVVGMLLPFFCNTSNKTLLWLFFILMLSPLLVDTLKIISNGKWNIANPFLEKAMAVDKRNGIEGFYPGNWLITHNSYEYLLKWSESGFWWSWQLRLDSNRIMKVFALFLLGLYVGRNQLYLKLEDIKPMLKKLQLWGLGIGIPAGLAFAWFESDKKSLPAFEGIWDTLMYALNVTPLAIGYVASITLWYLKGRFSKIWTWLQPVGRMALTNYIMQSVMGVFIYYGIGLGLGGRFGPALYMPIAFALFLLQVIYSNWWFTRFNYGPLEWIWRQLTYGKRLAFRKTKLK